MKKQLSTCLVILGLAACGKSGTKVISEAPKAEVSLFAELSSTTPGMAVAGYSVSATESVELGEVQIVFQQLAFGEMETGANEDDAMGDTGGGHMAPTLRSMDAGEGPVADSDEETEHTSMMALDQAGPFLLDLSDGNPELGTFMVSEGNYSMFEVHLGPLLAGTSNSEHAGELEGYSVMITGEVIAGAGTAATRKPVLVRLKGEAESQLMSPSHMAVIGHSMAVIRLDPTNWFKDLDLSAAAVNDATGSHYVIDDASTPALADEVFNRIHDSLRFGIDADGDEHVDDDEFVAAVGKH